MSIKSKLLSSKLGEVFTKLTASYHYDKRVKEWDRLIREESPEAVIRYMWKKQGMPYELNIENPRSFSEKLQWLKLNWYDERARQCANKLLVRDYVKGKGLGHILNDLYACYSNPDEIQWAELPEKFVLKPTHDSGHVIICKDNIALNKNKAKKKLRKWLEVDYFKTGEWQYATEKKIICEKFLENSEEECLVDYKFLCFNGKPYYIQVDLDRFTNHVINAYDPEWNYVPIQFRLPTDPKRIVPRPKSLDKMLEYAEILSRDFPFVRVDFYEVAGQVIFGELTFFHGGGYSPFTPCEKDFEIGKLLKLPKEKMNPWERIYREYGIKNKKYNP